ncbi:MAG: hypothetical protein M1829_002539 [Trizodia sp. TS-e1964]|nr:MAG: hypothetical protein M1829_002539 [Trizodia sp. TS-e1964]
MANLSPDARVLYVSDSVGDILGYTPQELEGKSVFEYFHPAEIPFARSVHDRGVQLDKAAVLSYCRIKNKTNQWVGCECVFTIVHDVLVASTSIYRVGANSKRRAIQAPAVRRLFSSSPQDPRYHMLSHLSSKFSTGMSSNIKHEPRAALILNRFTRTLTILFVTRSIVSILGVTDNELMTKSFYECIQENCLPEAIRCLERAKANDSIAYLRFWFRDPRHLEPQVAEEPIDDEMVQNYDDEQMEDPVSSDDEESGGVSLDIAMDDDSNERENHSDSSQDGFPKFNSRSSSGESAEPAGNTIFDEPSPPSTTASSPTSLTANVNLPVHVEPIEVEAVVSCTSDGLVVVLRRAKPIIPSQYQAARVTYTNGFFASPWAPEQAVPNPIAASSADRTFMPNIPATHQPALPDIPVVGPPPADFMNSIREVAVFAWALTGINGSLVQYGRGTPIHQAQPPNGMPVWDPDSSQDDYSHYHNGGGT